MSPRRGNDEGALYFDKSRKRWRAQISDRTGRHTITLKATTRSAAEKELRDLLDQRDQHTLPTGKNITLAAWMLDWVNRAQIRETVRDRYRPLINHHIAKTWLGKITLKDLEPADLERYYQECLDGLHSTHTVKKATGNLNRKHNPIYETVTEPRKLSPYTVVNIHRVISTALTDAARNKRIHGNPAFIAKPPALPRADLHSLTEDETRRILAAATKHPETEARWYLGLVFGLRPGEVLGLTTDRIKKDHIEIRQQLQQLTGNGMVMVPMPKTDAGNRDIPIPETVSKMLRRALTWKKRMRLQQGTDWHEYQQDGKAIDLVFVQPTGSPISGPVDRRQWLKLLAATNIPATRRYTARHTAASIMVSMGVDIAIVASILGHAKPSFTLDRYTHPLEDKKREASNRLGQFWG